MPDRCPRPRVRPSLPGEAGSRDLAAQRSATQDLGVEDLATRDLEGEPHSARPVRRPLRQSLIAGAGSDVGVPPGSGVAVPLLRRARGLLNSGLSLAVVGVAIYSAPLLLAGLVVAVLIAASLEVLVPLHPGRRSWRSAL